MQHSLQEKETYDLDINSFFVEDDLLAFFPENFCVQNSLLPLSFKNGTLTIVSDESKFNLSEEISQYIKFDKLISKKCKKDAIVCRVRRLYQKSSLTIRETLSKNNSLDIGEDISDKILLDAFQKQASDIHFCPHANHVEIKYRVDGMLNEAFRFDKEKWSSVCVRVKVLSEMDIAETRVPQDGSFSKEIAGKKIDFRVSSHPTMHGENIVLRVLGNSKSLQLEDLNYSEHIIKDLNSFVDMPDGLVIFTGPVGSGKTTSLYSLLSCLDPHANNIVTLEDPIECSIPFVRQTDINKSPNMSFSLGIKSLLRQDPNVMLIGEVRDADTAHMVMRAAMTGHKVFTTLHTNNAIGVFDRLMEFGVEKTLLLQYLKGIVSQRLVRKLCSCKQLIPNDLPESVKEVVNSSFIFKEVGCEKCNHTGFKGRVVVAESLNMKRKTGNNVIFSTNHNVKDLIPEDFKSSAMDGVDKIKTGETTYEELKRLIDIV